MNNLDFNYNINTFVKFNYVICPIKSFYSNKFIQWINF